MAAQKKRQELEIEMARLKVAKDDLELKTALAESSAKLKGLKEYEKSENGTNSHRSGKELRRERPYIEKALGWPQIKSDDGKALNAYAMFLVGCRNTMQDIDFLEEMDNPTNLRSVVSKLPYKMRERWRAEAYDIKERNGRRAKFADLVSYIDRLPS